MLFSASRLTRRGNRRLLSALVALVYLWAFVALGLTHTHAAVPMAPHRPSTRAAFSASPNGMIVAPAVAPDNDTPCAVCAAVHAATVALAQPPAATHIPAAVRIFAVRSASCIPTRNSSGLHLRDRKSTRLNSSH